MTAICILAHEKKMRNHNKPLHDTIISEIPANYNKIFQNLFTSANNYATIVLIKFKRLSGGVKTLLLIANDKNHVFNASTCGDNCAAWILKIAEDRKVEINLHHLMDFGTDESFILQSNPDNFRYIPFYRSIQSTQYFFSKIFLPRRFLKITAMIFGD